MGMVMCNLGEVAVGGVVEMVPFGNRQVDVGWAGMGLPGHGLGGLGWDEMGVVVRDLGVMGRCGKR